MQYIHDCYVFDYNATQGIINIESNTNTDFMDLIELGAGTKINELDFKYLCEEWIEKNRPKQYKPRIRKTR